MGNRSKKFSQAAFEKGNPILFSIIFASTDPVFPVSTSIVALLKSAVCAYLVRFSACAESVALTAPVPARTNGSITFLNRSIVFRVVALTEMVGSGEILDDESVSRAESHPSRFIEDDEAFEVIINGFQRDKNMVILEKTEEISRNIKYSISNFFKNHKFLREIFVDGIIHYVQKCKKIT